MHENGSTPQPLADLDALRSFVTEGVAPIPILDAIARQMKAVRDNLPLMRQEQEQGQYPLSQVQNTGRIKPITVWRDGVPFISTEPVIPKAKYNDILETAMSAPYTGYVDPVHGELVIEPHLVGKTMIEATLYHVAQSAAQGNPKSIEFVFDRLLGKPKQAIESTNLNMSYQDFLDSIAADTDNAPNVIDVTPYVQSNTPTDAMDLPGLEGI